MQFEITDAAATAFAREFYGAMADGYPLEAALAEARGAIRDEGNLTEWGTPVLYSRAPDGRLFDVTGLVQAEAERRARDEEDRKAHEAEARQARKEATPDAGEAARLAAEALDFLATIEKLKAGDSVALPTGAERISPARRELADQGAEPYPSLGGDAVIQLGSIFEEPASRPKWTAHAIKSSTATRALSIRLSDENTYP
jgi:hypothetical protein